MKKLVWYLNREIYSHLKSRTKYLNVTGMTIMPGNRGWRQKLINYFTCVHPKTGDVLHRRWNDLLWFETMNNTKLRRRWFSFKCQGQIVKWNFHFHNLVGNSASPLQGHLPVRLDMCIVTVQVKQSRLFL
jgi:hypothetical protein